MIPYLGCVVEYATLARVDNLFESLSVMISTCDESIEVVDIGLVVSA
jgi:hypothetical protein